MLDIFNTAKANSPVNEHSKQIGFNECAFTWEDESSAAFGKKSKSRFRLRFKDELVFDRGGINLIVGPTGSGKVR